MRVIFCGTPEIAVPALRALAADPTLRPLAVFTQPAARRARRGEPEPSPVGKAALALGLELHEVVSVNEGAALQRMSELQPDVVVVVAFGQILKKVVLNLPRQGCVNFHPSMLPAYRGAAPVQRAIMDGAVDSGLTVMRLVRKLDAGPILLQRPWRMDPALNAEDLLAEAGERGATMLLETLRGLETITPQPQDDDRATFAPMLTREDGILDFNRPAAALHNRVRAVQPWPRAECALAGRRVIVHRSAPADGSGPPGQVLRVGPEGITVACGAGALVLCEIQLEGKPRVRAADAANGLRLKPGAFFEPPTEA